MVQQLQHGSYGCFLCFGGEGLADHDWARTELNRNSMVGLVSEGVLVGQFLVGLAVESQTFPLIFLYFLTFLQNIRQYFIVNFM